MASINIHATKQEETKFIVREHGEALWIDIIRGDDTVSIFFKDKIGLDIPMSELLKEATPTLKGGERENGITKNKN